jgi:hypothetical protein
MAQYEILNYKGYGMVVSQDWRELRLGDYLQLEIGYLQYVPYTILS